MGTCRICGIEAGWFSKVHKDCLANEAKNKAKPASPIVGSLKSKKFHKRSCRYTKVDSSTLIDIPSVHDAIVEGFIACKICKPDDE